MTEAEWNDCPNLGAARGFLCKKMSRRQIRLFAVACCRRIWHLIRDESNRRAVNIAELLAEGKVGEKERVAVHASFALMIRSNAIFYSTPPAIHAVAACLARNNEQILLGTSSNVAVAVATAATGASEADWWATPTSSEEGDRWVQARDGEGEAHRNLVLEIGGPCLFRSVTPTPSCLTSTIMKLAEGIYQERLFDRMPILGDALEEAGCDTTEILNHCRQPGEHVRGCWVIDLLTGRT